jgi:hypothetical protein
VSYDRTSSQYNLIGNKISVAMTWSYMLKPQKVGKFTLPSIDISYDGKNYKTNSVAIEVLPAFQKPAPDKSAPNTYTDSFYGGTHKVEAIVDNPSPYVNEQATYTFRYLYTARAPILKLPKYTPPSFTGFWEKQLSQKKTETVIGGVHYWVVEIPVALFPITAGTITLEPAKLSLPTSIGPERVLVSNPVEIHVRPLPQAGKPADFKGVVGQYRIDAQVDRQTLEAGSALTLRVQVTGQGNIETLAAPIIPSLPGVTVYDPKITDAVSEIDAKIYGSRTYEYAIIPSQPGTQTIPAISYPYFDPQSSSRAKPREGQYQIASTASISLNVLPASNQPGATPTPQANRSDVQFFKQDIRYIKPSTVKLKNQSVYPHTQVSFWVLQTLPMTAVLLAWLYQRRQSKHDPIQLRRQNAAKVALHAIDEEEKKTPNEPSAFFAALANALYQYVGDILAVSPKGLTPELVGQRCKEAGLSEPATKQLVDLLMQCDYARFAPVSLDAASLKNAAARAKAAIHEAEKECGREQKT